MRFGTDENVLFVEVSSIQGLVSTQMCDLGQMKMSCLWRCPQFRGVLIERFHFILTPSNLILYTCIYYLSYPPLIIKVFDDSLPWQPIPVHTAPQSNDTVYTIYYVYFTTMYIQFMANIIVQFFVSFWSTIIPYTAL